MQRQQFMRAAPLAAWLAVRHFLPLQEGFESTRRPAILTAAKPMKGHADVVVIRDSQP